MRQILSMAMLLVFSITAGCATYGGIEKHFGKSYKTQKNAQIMNPKASSNLTPVTGLSGKAAEASLGKYIETFGKAPDCNAKQNYAPKDITGIGDEKK